MLRAHRQQLYCTVTAQLLYSSCTQHTGQEKYLALDWEPTDRHRTRDMKKLVAH